MSTFQLVVCLTVGGIGLIATLTLIVMVAGKLMERTVEQKRFQRRVLLAERDPLERLFERESYQR